MITPRGTVLKITASTPTEGVKAEVIAKSKLAQYRWCIKDMNGKEVCSGSEYGDGCQISMQTVFDAEMWTLDHPILYLLDVEVTFEDGEKETISDRFGFRYFDCDEKYLYLNGYPFYMRGYIRGCTAHEHENLCGLEPKEFYRKNIRMAKKYGFNAIRFHSTIPPRECFEVADEEGIVIHIEMRAENEEYENLTEMLYGKNDFVSDEELIEIIHTLYNHPSFMVYCVGNEIREPGKKPRIKEIRDFIKKHDPTRLFIDTCAHGEYDRDYVDFDVQHMGYFFPYGKHKDMFSDTYNLLCFGTVKNRTMVEDCGTDKIKRKISFKRPLLAHEILHYASWRDFYGLKEKFEQYGVEAPWWIDEEIKMIEAKGYKEDFYKLLQITKDYQFRCWKTGMEGIRSSQLLSGFHMLQFADTAKYENSNGVVDCFDDEQGISPEAFKAFNDDTVLVARLPKQVYEAGEQVQIPVILSQFALNPPREGMFHYIIRGNKNVYSQGTLSQVDIGESGIYELCALDCKLPDVDCAEKLILECKLEYCDENAMSSRKNKSNSWELWVFPKQQLPIAIEVKKEAKAEYLNKTFSFVEDSNLVIMDELNDSMFVRLEEGKDVLLLYRTDWTRHLLHKGMKAPKYSFRHTWDRFKGVIWDRGTINGGYDEKELLNKYGFCTDGQLNFQYYSLVDDCDKINLDDFPVKVKSLVSGIDKSSRDRFDPSHFGERELMYDRTMRNFSYAFELRVGKGRLFVTGLNFTGIEKNNIAARAMFQTLVSYCQSEDFKPQAEMSVQELKNYLGAIASEGPQKERMMTQYWQLDEDPVESMEYWIESERYLKED